MSLMRCITLLVPVRDAVRRLSNVMRLSTSALVQAGAPAAAAQASTSEDTLAAVKALRDKLTKGGLVTFGHLTCMDRITSTGT